jgi:hypothetical protein
MALAAEPLLLVVALPVPPDSVISNFTCCPVEWEKKIRKIDT